MILTVNIGNTHITVGGYEQDALKFCGRLLCVFRKIRPGACR